jgi:hypothetical protein
MTVPEPVGYVAIPSKLRYMTAALAAGAAARPVITKELASKIFEIFMMIPRS